ncbi:hypothetical protein [Algicola sagamiensis]|nr:hypothetical protein [Algicola sagamiensis]
MPPMIIWPLVAGIGGFITGYMTSGTSKFLLLGVIGLALWHALGGHR